MSNDCPHEWGDWFIETVVVLDTNTGITTRPKRLERHCLHCMARELHFVDVLEEEAA